MDYEQQKNVEWEYQGVMVNKHRHYKVKANMCEEQVNRACNEQVG